MEERKGNIGGAGDESVSYERAVAREVVEEKATCALEECDGAVAEGAAVAACGEEL